MEDNIFTLQFCQYISNIYLLNEELYHYKLSTNGLTCAYHGDNFYHKLSNKLIEIVKNYPSPFKENFLNKKIRFLYFHSFLSIVKQEGKMKRSEFDNFRKRFLRERNKQYSCLTLRLIFLFPSNIAYLLCLVYKMLCWLPGLRYPQFPRGRRAFH